MVQVRITDSEGGRPAFEPSLGDPTYPNGFSIGATQVSAGSNIDAIGLVVPPKLRPTRAAAKIDPTPVSLNAGMQSDYYNRIFVIPSLIELQNPVIGTPQNYSIWSAFFSANSLTGVVATGDTGLTNSVSPPEAFAALQLRDFNVTVDPGSPAIIDATYNFSFTQGLGTLRVLVTQVLVIEDRPNQPTVQILEYQTEILRAYDGSEQRIALRGNTPRESFSYDIGLPTDERWRIQRAQLFQNLLFSFSLPMWHEGIPIIASATTGQNSLFGDFTLSDLAVNDNIYILSFDETVNEFLQISAITDTQITLANNLSNNFPIGSNIYPVRAIQQTDGAGQRYYPVNAAERPLEGIVRTYRRLGGKGATVNTYRTLPLLDRIPLNNNLMDETNSIQPEIIDFGRRFQYSSDATFSNISRNVSYFINSRAELQYWKLFLDTVYGRREPFYTATYRSDLQLSTGIAPGSSQVRVLTTPNYNEVYFPSLGHKDLRFLLTPGNVEAYRRVTLVTDNGDGTQTLSLDSALPDLGPTTAIAQISLLELSRLGSDTVRFNHFSGSSRVELVVETIEE